MKRLFFCLMLVAVIGATPHVAAAQSLYGLFYQDGMEYFVRPPLSWKKRRATPT